MRNFILLSIIPFATLLGGCSDSTSQSGSTQTTASASFAVKLPEPEAKASYIDPSASYIEVRANETDIAGFDVADFSPAKVNLAWKQCYWQLSYDSNTESLIEPDKTTLMKECGPQPGSNQFPQVGERQVISRDNPVVQFDNLEAGKKYRFTAVLYDGDPAEETSRFLGWSTTFATLQEGSNPIELNMIQGSWEVANEAPVELQLLNRLRSNINVTYNGNPFFPTVDWYVDDTSTVATPALLLGLAENAGDTVSLAGFHVKAYDYYLNNDGSGTPPKAWKLQEQTGFGIPSAYPLGMLVPRKVLLETTDSKTLGEGIYEPDLSSIEGGSISIIYGMDLPTTLMQQYAPEQAVANRHSLSLGRWSATQTDGNNIAAHAGLEFLNPLDKVYQQLKNGGFDADGPIQLEGMRVNRVDDFYSSYQVRPGLDNVAYYSLRDETSNFVLSEGHAEDFTGLLEAQALQIQDGQTIEGTLFEYMGYDESTMASFAIPDLIENDQGELEPIDTAAAAATNSGGTASTLSLQERKQRFQARAGHLARMYWLSRQLGVTTASVPACFVEEFTADDLGSVWYQLNSEGIWEAAAPIQGEWYKDSDGKIITNSDGEVIYYNYFEGQMSEPGWEPPTDATSIYGVVEVDTTQTPDTVYQETSSGQTEICLQPIKLEASTLSPPAGSDF
ncbi:hypothetical protein [Marinospirillum sp.]|uniref:hypothetical protein n=1 Tax=Marinospirillum sp. TaxID=2183934 RepID=UPI00286FC834|nr:hypothetical protein [Marinospirillum sp.]MDR9468503.1 hypothetical protein [Marinospirillum sp.]